MNINTKTSFGFELDSRILFLEEADAKIEAKITQTIEYGETCDDVKIQAAVSCTVALLRAIQYQANQDPEKLKRMHNCINMALYKDAGQALDSFAKLREIDKVFQQQCSELIKNVKPETSQEANRILTLQTKFQLLIATLNIAVKQKCFELNIDCSRLEDFSPNFFENVNRGSLNGKSITLEDVEYLDRLLDLNGNLKQAYQLNDKTAGLEYLSDTRLRRAAFKIHPDKAEDKKLAEHQFKEFTRIKDNLKTYFSNLR